MDENKLWLGFWMSCAAVFITLMVCIAWSNNTSTNRLYDVQTLCIERNGAWSSKGPNKARVTVYNCQFTR